MGDNETSTCDWCLQEAPVQTIQESLWQFWKIISSEDPILAARKNICKKCKSRYEEFLAYIERCKNYTSVVEKIQASRKVEGEPLIGINYHPLIKKEVLTEDESGSSCSTSFSQLSFKCSHCIKAYSRSSDLKTHMCIHTGEKPFTCSICNKTYRWSSNLKAHIFHY